jgi:N-acetylmuramoyl-L-alanine amidase
MMRNLGQRSVRRAGLVLFTVMLLCGILLPSTVMAAPSQAVPASPSYSTWYTVRPGDTLTGIARMYGTTVNAIMQANNLYSTRIYVGQTLWIPSGGGGGCGNNCGGPVSCSQTYVVQPGDTLSGIARWFGVSTSQLAAANGIVNYSRIYVGQRLCIPAGGSPEPWPPPQPPAPPRPEPIPPQPGPGACGQWYTVRPGDTLSGIARCCGTTVQNLMWLNNLHNPNFIFVGQVLRTY